MCRRRAIPSNRFSCKRYKFYIIYINRPAAAGGGRMEIRPLPADELLRLGQMPMQCRRCGRTRARSRPGDPQVHLLEVGDLVEDVELPSRSGLQVDRRERESDRVGLTNDLANGREVVRLIVCDLRWEPVP